jgi:hypothetical protein
MWILDLAEVLVNACGPGSRASVVTADPAIEVEGWQIFVAAIGPRIVRLACELQVIGNVPIRIA